MTAAREPRRVLMTTDTVGGVWTFSLELCAELTARGVEVLLAAAGAEPTPDQRRAAAALHGVQLAVSATRLEWMARPWEDVDRRGEWLLALADGFRPDVVHLNDYAHGVLPWAAPVVVVGHSCVLSWFEAVRGHAAPAEWQEYRARVRAGLRAASVVVAPTAAMLSALVRHHGPLERTRVISNGARAERFPPAQKEPLIFSAGRLWDDAKNIGALVEVAPELPWPVAVAGPASLDGRADPLPGVWSLGRLPHDALARWLGRASIYALPARYEPFGLSVLEAALAGCALVIGDIPSLREVWGDTALYVPPRDHAALAATLRLLVREERARAGLARAARARALELTARRTASAYASTYRELLDEARAHARPGRVAARKGA